MSSWNRLAALLIALLLTLACSTVDDAVLVDTPPQPVPPATPGEQPAPATESEAFDIATAELDAELPFTPDLRLGTLDNGLRYYIRKNGKPEGRAEIRLAINAGSVLEDEDQLGMAHFLEHMLFNGTENFEKHELVDYLESIGMRFGADINAYTSTDETVYMLTVPTDDAEIVDKAFLVLADWAGGATLDPEEIDKERGVVLEEWRRGQGARSRLLNRQLPVVFKDSHYAERLPIGTPESIETSTPAAIRRFYEDWYRPDLMAVIAVGDFDVDRIEKLIRDGMSSLDNPAEPRPRATFEVPSHDETLFSIEADPELASTDVAVLYKHEPQGDGTVGDYRRSIVQGLHSAMFNARLSEIAQRPEPPFIGAFAGGGGWVRGSDMYQLNARVADGQLDSGLAALLTEVERVDRFGFTATELERAKTNLQRNYQQLLREQDKQPSAAFAAEATRSFLEGESMPGIEMEVALVERFAPSITIDEVNALGRDRITDDNRVIVVTQPERQDIPKPSQADLLAVFDGIAGQEIEPWLDQTREEPLLASMPTAGEVVDRKVIDKLGVTEWRLANGVRVVLKPTDFQNDQVLLSAFSPGGASLVDDDRLASASMATTLLGQSGVGSFSQVELGKALAGKVAGVSPMISDFEEGFRGSASPDDLETMLQLLYLHFTDPRLDPAAVQSFLVRARAVLENRSSQPETVFADRWTEVLFQGHPRTEPTTVEWLEKIDPQDALKIYRDRFADASDFTFLLVGNFVVDEVEPLIETYLGSLPSIDRQESWRDVGVRKPDGIERFEVEKGLEPKSQLRLQFFGPAEWTRENLHIARSLDRVLEIRLIEEVREEMGAAYSVGVSGGLSKRPNETYDVTISLTCDPDQVDPIIERIFQVIDQLKADGPDAATIAKVVESQRRTRETQLKENAFWLGVLETYYTFDLDPELLLDFEQLVEGVTIEAVQQAAQRYLDADRYVVGVLKPETVAAEVEAGR